MKRIICILLILSTFYMNGQARGKSDSGMTFGLEWGFVATVLSGHYHYFLAPEGYRVEDMGNEFGFIGNGDMYANIGYDFSSKWNLSLYAGYEGIADFHKAVPVSLRLTRYFGKDPEADRWFSFMELGSGICLKQEPQEIWTGKIGGGYSLALSRSTALNFILSARFIYTHPQIIYDHTPIPLELTSNNSAYAVALSFGMALKF